MLEPNATRLAVALARAGFAASALAKLTRALHEAKVIDDDALGEIAAVTRESAWNSDNPEVIKAMEILRAQMGMAD